MPRFPTPYIESDGEGKFHGSLKQVVKKEAT